MSLHASTYLTQWVVYYCFIINIFFWDADLQTVFRKFLSSTAVCVLIPSKGKKSARKLSDVEEEEESEIPDMEEEEEGEKENEELCNERNSPVSKPNKKCKRKNRQDASTEEPNDKKNKRDEKSNEQGKVAFCFLLSQSNLTFCGHCWLLLAALLCFAFIYIWSDDAHIPEDAEAALPEGHANSDM